MVGAFPYTPYLYSTHSWVLFLIWQSCHHFHLSITHSGRCRSSWCCYPLQFTVLVTINPPFYLLTCKLQFDSPLLFTSLLTSVVYHICSLIHLAYIFISLTHFRKKYINHHKTVYLYIISSIYIKHV